MCSGDTFYGAQWLNWYWKIHDDVIKWKHFSRNSWLRHQMEPFSSLLAICAGNSPVPGEFPTQMSVTRSFDVFFDLRLNKRLSKQSWGWWFETLSRPLWRHCNINLLRGYAILMAIVGARPSHWGHTFQIWIWSKGCDCYFAINWKMSLTQKLINPKEFISQRIKHNSVWYHWEGNKQLKVSHSVY